MATVVWAPAASSNEPETLGEAILRLALEETGGDLSQTGAITTWTADGPVVRTITGHEFVDYATQVVGAMADRAPTGAGPEGTDAEAGLAVGSFYTALPALWPFCDYATVFIFYFGTTPGAAFSTQSMLAPDLTMQPPLCGGAFGPTAIWEDVTLDKTQPGVGGVLTYCGAAVTWLTGTVDIPVGILNGGYICDGFGGDGFQAGAGHGRGVVTNFNLGSIQLDVFFGGGNAITLGNPT